MAAANERKRGTHRTRFPRCFGTMSREKVMKYPRGDLPLVGDVPELKQHYLFREKTRKRPLSRTAILFSASSFLRFIAEGRTAGNYENLTGEEFSGLRFAVFPKFIAPHELNRDNIAFLMLCMRLQLLEALPRNSGMIISRNRRDAKRIQSVASKCMINKREMGDALFFRAFSAHARRSVCVFSRGMREGEFNNAAGKWRRVFRDSRLWKEFRTYNKRHNANTSRQKGRLERAQATLLRGNILMRKH